MTPLLSRGSGGGEFRLHPIGPSGQSKGCITLYNQSHFKLIAGALLRTPGEIVPGTNLIAHGVVQVY
ncbi:MAG TPA: tlde1 domain-containing protein [Buttiauxella sp.]|uniref:tlde1 domain-containing protein n=1 Tax=Buttiauxella sp. TaxID=1972222 RepID=UPI002B46320C|nr:tlde1 domain-containing protein [Buttiauxella sp.]HKM97522.1 tlde1 domain-containing protein [Buttiauxella sp.]